MRLLFAIPHFFGPLPAGHGDGRRHASTERDAEPRIAALARSITALHALYGPRQCIVDFSNPAFRTTRPANQAAAPAVDVVLCTTGTAHVLDRLPIAPSRYTHRPTAAAPMLLGFECHAVLRERLGRYDYYGYLEDDLVLHDPWFFIKLAWFTSQTGNSNLLQPNRFETGAHPLVDKAYIDGDLPEQATARYMATSADRSLRSTVLGVDASFHRARNPHAGCFFLNAAQMECWAARPDFLDRDTSLIGPLESAATLGILRAFTVYKPAPPNASFLEIEHAGTAFLGLIQEQPAHSPADRT
jgi:hypothetical protein